MSEVVYKTEQEVQKLGFEVLYQSLGATDFIRFMQQFSQGYGNYTEDRQQWQKEYSVDAILAEMNEQ
ncbi:hypothetical protein [Methylocucumis oryzae]|uniref:Uncharacterized protein n=1 Tax=Methylocucumis oryzae TaxID=1632867 RepID=A0A0F3IL14_9GAMM|nr:hypothetical protein [Methylocucumis oryzae]KJV07367.1 hypothetical protein VZ94_05315 [Methylocucumis oryzae]